MKAPTPAEWDCDMFTKEQWSRADEIERGLGDFGCDWIHLALALLTSPNKMEREQGKTLVRHWKNAGKKNQA